MAAVTMIVRDSPFGLCNPFSVPRTALSSHEGKLASGNRVNIVSPDYEYDNIGFRVASEVPEPSSLLLLSLSGLALLKRKRRA